MTPPAHQPSTAQPTAGGEPRHRPRVYRLRDALEPWCAAGATGGLRALDPPGGVVYLHNGRLTYAECPVASGVDRLLTASGRLSADAWRAAVSAGRGSRRVGDELVQRGLLTPTELETIVLAALYGAAHFLFDTPTDVRFDVGAGHPIGQVVDVELRSACAEVDRRHRMLANACADSRVDSHAIVPARRLSGDQVALTALQWEIVANADRRRTPTELARSLGRDTFAMLLEVRRLARAGLVEPGRPGTTTNASSPASGSTRSTRWRSTRSRIRRRTTAWLPTSSLRSPMWIPVRCPAGTPASPERSCRRRTRHRWSCAPKPR